MVDSDFRLDFQACGELLRRRLAEPAPSRIQLLAGPRQVGKTTLLLQLAAELGDAALYVAGDGPEAAVPGSWERTWARATDLAAKGRVVVLLDEAHLVPDWSAKLKGEWDRLRRKRLRVHVIATGSSALHLGAGSRESLAGRFERLTLTHWSASSLVSAFGLSEERAVDTLVRRGSYPGAVGLLGDVPRWLAYVRDAIVEPAIGRDLLALAAVRKPALLRQVFGIATSSPAQIVSLQKIQGRLQDRGALETIAHYLSLLEEAYLVAALPKYTLRASRKRAAPPKLVTLSNAFLAVVDPGTATSPTPARDRLGAWIENACLAHAWISGQQPSYWREEPHEVDVICEGSWGPLAIEVKTGAIRPADLRGLGELTRRHRQLRPLVLCDDDGVTTAERAGFPAQSWQSFLLQGPRA